MRLNTRFEYQSHKGDRVTIYVDNRPVTNLKGTEAVRFLSKVDGATRDEQQLAMAKVTGNFKRVRGNKSNERR